MDRGLLMLLGMSISYLASLAGMAVAYWGWKRHIRTDRHKKDPSE